jgi:hypothetical protein
MKPLTVGCVTRYAPPSANYGNFMEKLSMMKRITLSWQDKHILPRLTSSPLLDDSFGFFRLSNYA